MIPRSIESITSTDLDSLLANKVPEGKTIEYKRDLPGTSDSERVKFLAAVSSFANTSGGDLIYGVEAKDGVPLAIAGLGAESFDKVKLRLDGMLRHGLEPRLPRIDLKQIGDDPSKGALLLRIAKSWLGPHRVRDSGHFYGRNSAGKYPLDVGELREAFLQSMGLAERVRSFRAERLIQIEARRTPVAFAEAPGILVLHIIPLDAFGQERRLDLARRRFDASELQLIDGLMTTQFPNLEGLVGWHQRGTTTDAYVQIFNSGIIESVASLYTEHAPPEHRSNFAPKRTEPYLVQAFASYLKLVRTLEVPPPFHVAMTLLGVSAYRFAYGEPPHQIHKRMNPTDTIELPGVVVDAYERNAEEALKPIFDSLWRAFHFDRALTYDETTGRRLKT